MRNQLKESDLQFERLEVEIVSAKIEINEKSRLCKKLEVEIFSMKK